MNLVNDVETLLNASPRARATLNLGPFTNFSELMGALFTSLCGNSQVGKIFAEVYRAEQDLVELTHYDITETARRNFESGSEAATLLFSRGVQAVIAHRIANKIWTDGDTNLAQTIKATCGRAFSTDLHPAASIGAGLWLDHGLGLVVGETCVIDEDVSIWHNVTLGSTLNDSGSRRHPHIGRGVVIGAGAILLGGITIGANANIAAGAIVVEDVAAGALFVGNKAQQRGDARISFANTETPT